MKEYNTTQLSPYDVAEKNGTIHRDYISHCFRWNYVVKNASIWEIVCDFWCGTWSMGETLYRNKYKQNKYIWFDIKKSSIEQAKKQFEKVEWMEFIEQDLINPTYDLQSIEADKVISFEVIEHVNKKNWDKFLENFRKCGKPWAIYYLSTPNYDENVWAADNHIYDWQVQEYKHEELQELIERYFTIEKKYGTFASQKDYKDTLTPELDLVYKQLKEYYDSNLVSVIMAPLIDAKLARNCLWVLRNK